MTVGMGARPAAAARPSLPAAAARPQLIAVLALGAFVAMADATVVAVALDPISRHFGTPLAGAQAVLAVYLIAITAALPTIGRLGDRFGRRNAYLAGFGLFGATSLLAATAGSLEMLLLARALQALGGALLTSGSLALIAEHSPQGRTGRSVAILVIVQALAGMAGPPLGGALVAAGGWQAVFWATAPLAALGCAVGFAVIPADTRSRALRLDIPGSLLTAGLLGGIGLGIASLAAPVVAGAGPAVWFSVAWLSLLLLVPAELIARHPVLDGRLLRRPAFSLAALATLLSTGTLMSCFAFLPFWLENAHGSGALLAGLAFLPIGMGIGVTSRRGGALADSGRTRLSTAVGMLVASLGLALAGGSALSGLWPLLPVGLLLLGCGNGLFSAPNTSAAISLAPRDALGSASGLLSTARNGGVIVGLGVTAAVYGSATGTAADSLAAAIFTAAAVICLGVAVLAALLYREPSPRD